jgi:hypothetical protein
MFEHCKDEERRRQIIADGQESIVAKKDVAVMIYN